MVIKTQKFYPSVAKKASVNFNPSSSLGGLNFSTCECFLAHSVVFNVKVNDAGQLKVDIHNFGAKWRPKFASLPKGVIF